MELFHLLLELAEGYQLGDASTNDTFTNLSLFVQRLVREDERDEKPDHRSISTRYALRRMSNALALRAATCSLRQSFATRSRTAS